MKTHFRFLPSTRKLRARLKREINDTARLCREVGLMLRAPVAQRRTNYSEGYGVLVALQATIFCATLAHMRGRIHAGRWSAEGQAEFIKANVGRAALTAPQQAMIAAALEVPAKEKARLANHRERADALKMRAGAA